MQQCRVIRDGDTPAPLLRRPASPLRPASAASPLRTQIRRPTNTPHPPHGRTALRTRANGVGAAPAGTVVRLPKEKQAELKLENELYACYFNAKNHVEGETLTRSVQGISVYEKWLAMNDPEKLVAFMQKSTTAKQRHLYACVFNHFKIMSASEKAQKDAGLWRAATNSAKNVAKVLFQAPAPSADAAADATPAASGAAAAGTPLDFSTPCAPRASYATPCAALASAATTAGSTASRKVGHIRRRTSYATGTAFAFKLGKKVRRLDETIQLSQRVQEQLSEQLAAVSSENERLRSENERQWQQYEDITTCVVCKDAPRSVALLPCGHVVLCGACCQSIREEAHPRRMCCPLCRRKTKDMDSGLFIV